MDVRTQVTDFNWEIDLFLRSLARFREQVNKADSNTIQLLSDTLESIGEFINGHEDIVEKGEKSQLFVVEESKFEIARFITCRICCLQIPLTRTEYLNHVTSDYHNAKLIRHAKANDQNGLSPAAQSSASIDRGTNGKPPESNGNRATNVLDRVNNNPATKASVAKGTSWRDREPAAMRASPAPTPNGTINRAVNDLMPQWPYQQMQYPGLQYPSLMMNNNDMGYQKIGPPLFSMQRSMPIMSPFPIQMQKPFQPPPRPNIVKNAKSQAAHSAAVPVPSPSTTQSEDLKALIELTKLQKKPAAATAPAKSTTQLVESSAAPTAQSKLQGASKSQPVPVATLPPSLSTPQSAPAAAAPKNTSIVPPNVFDEDIFEFIESQGNAKRAESLQPANKPEPSLQPSNQRDQPSKSVNKPEQSLQQANKLEERTKIVKASKSAEIKPCKPYELNSMYSKFSHLKPSASAAASVPIATKPAAAAKPVQTNSLNGKSSDADDLQIHKFLSKAAQKPNQPSNDTKSQNSIARNTNATTEARPALSAGLSGKLKQMFDEINKLKSKAELEEIQATRTSSVVSLQRTSSIVSLPAAGTANDSKRQVNESRVYSRSQHSPAKSHVRGRSLSNSNIADTSKGAIPKQRASPNTNNNNINRYDSAKQREALTKFFSRDLTPFLSNLMRTANELDDLPVNKTISEEIEQLLLPKFPTAKCHLIGSRMYGIGKATSPIDIYLNLHDSFHQDKAAKIFSDGITTAEQLFNKSAEWSEVKCSELTRYGILSVTHNATKIKCRMIFGTGVPVRNTKVVQSLFDAQPVCRQLVICIQSAMYELNNLSFQRFKNGYVASMLVLFYFQKQGKLPSVKSMQEGCTARMKCGENAVEFQKPTGVSICSDRFLNILISFFKFYSEFDFAENIISVFQGQEISQSIQSTPDHKLDASLLRFKRFYGVEPWKWPSDGMCVQDIFMHKRNVTLPVSRNDIAAFQNFCKDALHALQSVGPSVRY